MTSATQFVEANGITIAYQSFGDSADPPMVMVMGLGAQMIVWPDEMCQDLATRGHYVVRFDNRDAGESTHFHDSPVSVLDIVLGGRRLPYQVTDMAKDTIGLINALGLGSVHLVSSSMGGFISQTVALLAPAAVKTLTLIQTSTGSLRVGHPSWRVMVNAARQRVPQDQEAAVAEIVASTRLTSSPGYPYDEEWVLDIIRRSNERSYDPDGYFRQTAAARSQADRTRLLARITAPTLVMHGLADPLISASGGIAVARAIPGAKFIGFWGMGHDLPRALWPVFVDEICALTAIDSVPAS
ncbi:MAG: alpha/beta hydrolase [Actinomycetes bacterium]